MNSHAPEAFAAIGALVLLLIWCGRLMWANRRSKRDMERMLATGIWSAYSRGLVDRAGNVMKPRHSVMGELWHDARKREDTQ